MQKRWIIVTDHYAGMEKNGVNMLYAAVAGHLPYVLPVMLSHTVTDEELAESNLILVGKLCSDTRIQACQKENIVQVPEKDEGYSVYVGESMFAPERQMIVIAGYDAAGVLYGCMDFCNRYLGDILYRNKNIWTDETFEEPFGQKLNPWQVSTAPGIKSRGIWTWGHVIYDYRKFFENMAKLRLNQVVIWNDVAPLNARDVVEYAHSLNIKVIWGFAWGWGTSCEDILEHYDAQALETLKEKVIGVYRQEYADTGCDGIYFQSFTEMDTDNLNGKCVAELVTELVNYIAGSLLDAFPDLQLQFGLHATSVRNRLEYIKKVDKRVRIVWENCGSFPYDYFVDNVADFENTLAFTREILQLRGDGEKWGAVLKGMLKLDWLKFEHFSQPYILGERTAAYMEERQIKKNRIWKYQQAGWIKNAEYVRRILEAAWKTGKDTVVQALVEDAMFEQKIMFPVALYAEMLWTPADDPQEMTERVARYPDVYFSNI